MHEGWMNGGKTGELTTNNDTNAWSVHSVLPRYLHITGGLWLTVKLHNYDFVQYHVHNTAYICSSGSKLQGGYT